ncbi:MAG: hypothetical protein IKP31_03300, partial [Lachnospiraceae bacterium]|nr:hypothetical protein [Lachnospiraceae bacterium]
MNKRLVKNMFTGILAASVMLLAAGCGKNVTVNINNIPSDTDKTETDGEEAKEPEVPEEKEYKSNDGWVVKYDPSVITVNESEDMTGFVYTGESAGTNMLSISYTPDKQPEEVLTELTEGWGDQDKIVRSESYFPGTSDKWGYWRSLPGDGIGSGLSENVFAGEYNGGVLMFEFTT